VSAFFVANALAAVFGSVTATPPLGGGAATVTPTGTPSADYDVTLIFDVGGTAGTPGLVVRASLDGGETYAAAKTLDASLTFVAVDGSDITITLGAGTVSTGQRFDFVVEPPRRVAPVLFGWREYYAQINQGPKGGNRIVFLPGDGLKDGREGVFEGPLAAGMKDLAPVPSVGANVPPGVRARHIVDWRRLSTISVWGVDPARPQNDEASYEQVDLLVEDLTQALQNTIAGLYKFESAQWNSTVTDTAYGRELRISLSLRSTLFDLPRAVVAPSPIVHRDPPT
jgi:hypothetical protein